MVVTVYIHVVALGAIVLSGFWSLLNERFDPRSGKRYFGRIAGIGTFGGIMGGLTAERFASLLPATAILLFLAGMHLLCGAISFLMVHYSSGLTFSEHASHEAGGEPLTSASWSIFQRRNMSNSWRRWWSWERPAPGFWTFFFKTGGRVDRPRPQFIALFRHLLYGGPGTELRRSSSDNPQVARETRAGKGGRFSARSSRRRWCERAHFSDVSGSER